MGANRLFKLMMLLLKHFSDDDGVELELRKLS